MVRPYTTNYYFSRSHNLMGFEHISTDGTMLLDNLCGATLADAFCNDGCGLELVRFKHEHQTLIIMRRLTDIKVTLTTWR